jgi:threonylcarbamoyladenosine tRNA methylthiotransferase MtaB
MVMTETAAPAVAFATLGCKVNYSESEALARQFLARGYHIVPFEEAADVYVVNTCTVTHVADRKSRGEIRAAARRNPAALVAATGCYVSIANHGLEGVLPGNVLIVTNAEKDRLVEVVERARAARTSCTSLALETDAPASPPRPAPGPATRGAARPGGSSALPVPLAPSTLEPLRAAATPAALGRTRANLKVQDGCNAGCAFCIIPRARGGPRSVPLAEAVMAARRLEEWGYREIVVSGVLLGSYGRDLPDAPRLRDLLEGLLEGTREARIRVSSVEPQDVDRDLFALWRHPRLCRHLHLPLQSGSTAILQAMRRKYSAEWYAQLVQSAVADIPGVAITIDIMVGFPGEDERLFEESYRLVEVLPLAGMHVFTYSPRRGTAAARFPNQVPEPEKDRRSALLRALAARQSERFRRRHLGATRPVLWEEQHDGLWSGLTDNYVRVYSRDAHISANTITPTRLVELCDDGVFGVHALRAGDASAARGQ